MIITDKIKKVRNIIKTEKSEGKIIGLVPTMGALHAGHLSLIEKSVKTCDFTVVSIFVNPIQFGKGEDLEKYPRALNKDSESAKESGANLIFAPDTHEILGTDLLTHVDIEKLQDNLCGAKRPGHFKGVCTIVTKLFNIVTPDKAFFGKKDIQQLHILKKMTEDLNFNIDIVPCDIARENDGLAMSSRNAYLSDEERKQATVLYKSLKEAVKIIEKGETKPDIIINNISNIINSIKNSKIDYIKIVNEKMMNVTKIEKGNIIALAVFIGNTRLIDNNVIGEKL